LRRSNTHHNAAQSTDSVEHTMCVRISLLNTC